MSSRESSGTGFDFRQLKDYLVDDTYKNLINCMDAYEKYDYMSCVIWAAVFNERFINDLARLLDVRTKSQSVVGLSKIIKDVIASFSVEQQSRFLEIIEASRIVQNTRNGIVHGKININKEEILKIYDAIGRICKNYIETDVAKTFYERQSNLINVSHVKADEVYLQLENIGKISNANIKIDGLTVLVGENSSGKSTLGRALFLITKTFNNMESNVIKSQKNKIEKEVRSIVRRSGVPIAQMDFVEIEKIVNALVECPPANVQEVFVESIPKEYSNYLVNKDGVINHSLEMYFRNIFEIRSMSFADLSKQAITNEINTLFDGRICKIGTTSGTIALKYNDDSENIIRIIKNDHGDECVGVHQNQEIAAAPCMITPSEDLFDNKLFWFQFDNVIDSFNAKEATSKFETILSKLIEGRIIISNHKLSFEQEGLNEPIQIKNLSSGVKAIAALEWKLRQGEIGRGSVLILDEPEVSLHPEWQIRYAQIIVQLQKELNLHILIMTHSPYFLQALEYSAKLGGIGNKYHCYLTESNNDITRISCVDKYPSYAYKKMIEPFAELDTMREQLESITNEN